MRIVAGFFGVLFMLAGAAAIAFGLTEMPASTYATGDEWRCIATGESEQTCRFAGDSPQDVVVQSMWVQTPVIIGGALFVGGAALAGGATAGSGRRQVHTVAPAQTPQTAPRVPAGPPQPPPGR